MFWWLLCGLLLPGLAAVLFTQLRLRLDSTVPQLDAAWGRIISARIYFDGEWRFRFSLFFINRNRPLSSIRVHRKTKKHTRKKHSPDWTWTKTMRMLRALKVDHWEMAIDSGDYLFNALLFPLNFYPPCSGHLQVNYEGRQYFQLQLHTSLANLLWAWMRSRNS